MNLSLFQLICVVIAIGFVLVCIFLNIVESFDDDGNKHPVICSIIFVMVICGLASIKF